ncbi:hypothetical protein [Actinomadura violacea]|uniref:Uncharacterized protein n=1 Tax=Actinomadura violacea TaxID=2819934 RepID=A0ABS3S4T0_9ACTN|nr:hypothetical protein [Actinomadura violacea]MBO2464007.1 hypothetical protein [Actinomadura violacea]
MEQRGWTCELVADAGDTVLRARPPGAGGGESGDDEPCVVEIVIRDRGQGEYFAYKRSAHRLICSTDELEKAVRALELVYAGNPPPPPAVPPGLAAFAAAMANESP